MLRCRSTGIHRLGVPTLQCTGPAMNVEIGQSWVEKRTAAQTIGFEHHTPGSIVFSMPRVHNTTPQHHTTPSHTTTQSHKPDAGWPRFCEALNQFVHSITQKPLPKKAPGYKAAFTTCSYCAAPRDGAVVGLVGTRETKRYSGQIMTRLTVAPYCLKKKKAQKEKTEPDKDHISPKSTLSGKISCAPAAPKFPLHTIILSIAAPQPC